MIESKNRIEWIDSLRVAAILAVITIHISSPIVKDMFDKNMTYWWIGNVLDSAVRFGVPLFLMISGALLLSRKYDLKDFYTKRIIRVLLPFLFYMIVYWIFRWSNLSPEAQSRTFNETVQWAAALFLKEGISPHFWFVYLILFLYIFTPMVGAFVRKLKPEMIVFLLAAWVLIGSISQGFPVNMYTWAGADVFKKLYIYLLYMGYMVLGYYFYNIFYVSKNIRLTAAVLYLITVVVSALVVYFTSHTKGKLDLAFYSYLNLNTIIQTAAVFISMKHTKIRNKHIQKVTFLISDYSYGIYLIHVLVLGVLFNRGISWTMAHPLISLPVLLVLTLLVSMMIIFIIRKIPFGKWISG
ncbi:MAG: acyltransferase family protein [Porphyromonadaceae bacterium]|nr:acyltransferase family protein [Porphyromonadaceae bacterium]